MIGSSSTLGAQDQLAIQQLLASYPRIVDQSQWDRLGEIFTADAILDVRVDGMADTYSGIEAIRQVHVELKSGDGPGVGGTGHHCTNVVIGSGDGRVQVNSSFISLLGVPPTVSARYGQYQDEVVETPEGWRISTRLVAPL